MHKAKEERAPFANSHSCGAVVRRAGGLLNSLRDSVQVFIGSWICFRVKSGIKWRWCWGWGEGGVPRILTIHPDNPQAASGGFPDAGSHKSHCSPLLDMGFGPE